MSLLSWRSQKSKRIVRSTLGAETLACVTGLDNATLIQHILDEITGLKLPIYVATDNESLVAAVHSTKCVSDRRLQVDIAYLRSVLQETGDLTHILWVPTALQLADGLKKYAPSACNMMKQIIDSNCFKIFEKNW